MEGGSSCESLPTLPTTPKAPNLPHDLAQDLPLVWASMFPHLPSLWVPLGCPLAVWHCPDPAAPPVTHTAWSLESLSP